MAYCGQTRSPVLVQRLVDHGVGECTLRGELLSRKRDPWFYDNGAYRDWQAEKEFDALRFVRDMRRMTIDRELGDRKRKALCGRKLETFCGAPDFVVAPDLVAQGAASLEFTREWFRDLEVMPTYLAVQDGMTRESVLAFLRSADDEDGFRFAGIFVGGRLEWKLETASQWIELAHEIGMRCHIGRVGTPDRVIWAYNIGADSIDSSLPLMFTSHMDAFLEALAECGGSQWVAA